MSSHIFGAPPSEPIDPESHGSVLALLPEYVTQLVLGQRIHPDWQPLRQHLRQCRACRAEYNSLYQQMQATYNGTLPAVTFTPTLPPFLREQRARRPQAAHRHRTTIIHRRIRSNFRPRS
ncbi:MAG: hypothetical protein HC822_15795 [Oscillochloris sp.]|nr:hypothetical protein [Oscillochloris sp.]